MIDEIQVQNLALIRDASLRPSAGFTVLTGETGVGKTALLSALQLLMGGRAHADLVRDGEDALQVAGRFYDGDDERVVSRLVTADGRSRVSIDGSMASVGELAQCIAPTVDLCGQMEYQQLMRPASHVRLLDAWAGDAVDAALCAYGQAWDAAQEAARALDEVQSLAQEGSARLDDARFTLRRIDEVDPKPDEYDSLKHDLSIAENSEQLAVALSAAREALSGDGGAIDALGSAVSALDQAALMDSGLAVQAQALREAGYVLDDIAAQVRDSRDRVAFDPETLADMQERFSALQGLMRSFGPTMEDVLERREQAARIVELSDSSEQRLREAQQAFDQAEADLARAADALDDARCDAAPRFAEAVGATMRKLEMGGATLHVALNRLSREAWTRGGASAVEFMYSSAEGVQPRPFARIASGGEVSRVMLAIKVALGANDDVDTLVFDEVDAGIGGAVAVALAGVVASLAQTHQVIAVTHLAQLAVRADTHYVVAREDGAQGTQTTITQVEGEQRVAEVARMLSGSSTERSLAHARELLADAARGEDAMKERA